MTRASHRSGQSLLRPAGDATKSGCRYVDIAGSDRLLDFVVVAFEAAFLLDHPPDAIRLRRDRLCFAFRLAVGDLDVGRVPVVVQLQMTSRTVTPQGQAVGELLGGDRTDLPQYPLQEPVPIGTLLTSQVHGLEVGIRVVGGVGLLQGLVEGAARGNPQEQDVVGHRPQPTCPRSLIFGVVAGWVRVRERQDGRANAA